MENNKIIAEFEGHIINYGFNKKGVLFLNHHISEQKLLYHTSWNWLIPIIKKIREIINVDLDFSDYDDIRDFHKKIDPYNLTIEQVYSGVIEFIKWYNLKK